MKEAVSFSHSKWWASTKRDLMLLAVRHHEIW